MGFSERATLGVEDNQKISLFSSSTLSATCDFRKKRNCYVRDPYAKGVSSICLKTTRNQVRLIVEKSNCIKNFLSRSLTYLCGTTNDIRYRSRRYTRQLGQLLLVRWHRS